MPSFDVVSEVDKHELANALDQTNRELDTRYDFKGADAKVELQESALMLHAESDFQVQQIQPMLYQRLSKRGIEISCLEADEIKVIGQRAQQRIKIREGIDKELAKKVTKLIKDGSLKVQVAIQGEQLRVTGKKRDDLQAAMALIKSADLELPMQFQNFRD